MAEIHQQKRTIETLNNRLADLQAQNMQLQRQLGAAQQMPSSDISLKQQLLESQDKNEKLKQANAKLVERKLSVDKKLSDLQRDGDQFKTGADLRREITRLNGHLQKLSDENYQIGSDKRKVEQDLSLLKLKHEQVIKDNESLKRVNETMKRDLDLQTKAYQSMADRRRDVDEWMSKGQNLAKQDKDHLEKEQKLALREQDFTKREKNLDEWEQNLTQREHDLNKQLKKLETDKEDIHTQRNWLADARKTQQEENVKKDQQIDKLQCENERLKQNFEQINEQLQRERESRPPRSISNPDVDNTRPNQTGATTVRSNSEILQLQTMMISQNNMLYSRMQDDLRKVQQENTEYFKEILQLKNDMGRIKEQNTQYHRTVGRVHTSMQSSMAGHSSSGGGQSTRLLVQLITELLQIGGSPSRPNQPYHHGHGGGGHYRPHEYRDDYLDSSRPRGYPSSQYPAVRPFPDDANHYPILDLSDTALRPLKCSSCDTTFSTNAELQKHKETCHTFGRVDN